MRTLHRSPDGLRDARRVCPPSSKCDALMRVCAPERWQVPNDCVARVAQSSTRGAHRYKSDG
eukprot:7361902-Ditylum_brightwellii.AAC.1